LYCPAQRLVIELDGSQHLTCAGKAEDAVRTAYLEQRGVRVLRFTNLEVLQETTAVLEAVQRAVSTSRQS
jgi:very-short-patch-repair endonuclease